MINQKLSPAFPPEKKVYLQTVIVVGLEIDICPLTGGIWFDRFELKKFDEAHEDLSELMKWLPKNPLKPEVLTGRQSPRHPQAKMQQQPYGPKGANGVLQVDICPISAGIWLDFQEIQKIRELYPQESDKTQAVQMFVNDTFSTQLKKAPQQSEGLKKILNKILAARNHFNF